MSSAITPQRLAYRVVEVAELLGVSRAHVYNLITRGELRAVKIGGSTRIPRDELGRLLDLEGFIGGEAS